MEKSRKSPTEKIWRRPRKLRGLGDVAAVVAQPVAIAIDAVLHTNLTHCEKCKERQTNLNRMFPF